MTVRQRSAWMASLLLVWPLATVMAQSVRPHEELRAHVGLRDAMPLPDAGVFGEQINPATGEMSLVQTDAQLATNGLPLSLTRRFVPGSAHPEGIRIEAFADWQLDLPRITTLTLRYPDGHGWRVAGDQPYARCSAFAAPPTVRANGVQARLPDMGVSPIRPPDGIIVGNGTALNPEAVDPNVWWQGYQLVLPGSAAQELLRRDAGNALIPEMMGANGAPMRFPIVTAQQWQLDCLDHTDNGEPGEAFVAVAPDGTKYIFSHLIYQAAPALLVDGVGTLARWRASLLVTRIEDRFGNHLNFTYEGDRLIMIAANDDEARLSIEYRNDVPGLIDRVILRPFEPQPRVWVYHYANLGTGRETLSGVTRPDGSRWSFGLQEVAEATISYSGTTTCDAVAPFDGAQTFSGTMIDPNGLTSQVTLAGIRHHRSNVSNDCKVSKQFPWSPSSFDTLSLTKRSYQGTGLGTLTWSYRYGSSAATAWTESVDPDQRVTRITYSNIADAKEGRLLAVEANRQVDGSTSRSTHFDYVAASTGSYPATLGAPPRSRVNIAAWGSMLPLAKQTITQDGDNYFTDYAAFNAFGQPTQIRQSNSIAGQQVRDIAIDYLNDRSHWMLGLTQSITDRVNNTVMSRYVYDLARVTLTEDYRFGQKQAAYTYTTQGLLASVSDGNGLTTHYQDHVLSIPRTIAYPDGLSESRRLDSFGNVVSVTDRAGLTTTADYDVMGRLTRMGTPRGNGETWNDTAITYTYGSATSYGLQSVTRGAASQWTYRDALGRLVLTQANDGHGWISQRQDVDWRGLPTFSSVWKPGALSREALESGVHITYDALGRPIQQQQDSEQGALTTSTAYLSGARTQVTKPKGGVTTTHYQVFGAPNGGAVTRVEAPEGVSQIIVRDVYGLPLSLTQSGLFENAPVSLTRQYVYDEAKHLCRIIEPETSNTVIDVDAGGRESWRAQGVSISGSGCGREQVPVEARTTRNYDTMNRLLSVSYPAGTSGVQLRYDALGHVLSADTGLSQWSYAYNGLGSVTSETLTVDGIAFSLRYAYDANGGRTSTIYPDGRTVEHAPDAWGRPTQAGAFAGAARYLPTGELEYFKYGNGIEYLAESNARELPNNLSYTKPDGSLLFSQDFTYDTNGNLTRANDLVENAARPRVFDYDSLNRLTQATLPNAVDSETYSYDPLNNLRRVVANNGLQRDYGYDPLNRLQNARGSDGQTHQFVYDQRGNVIQRDTTPFTFDIANRLTEVSGRESYVYDAFGRRVAKTRLGVGGSKSYYVYSHAGQLMLQRDNDASSSETDFIYLGGKLIAQATTRRLDLPGAINFTPGSPTDGRYSVTWGRADGAVTYELDVQHDGGPWEAAYRGRDTTYTPPFVTPSNTPGGTYLYRLRACASNCGDWVVSSPMGVNPDFIGQFHFPQGVQTSDYRVSWDAPYSATTYFVDEGETDQSGQLIWTRVADDLPHPYVDRPGNRVGTYQYRVMARNAYGDRGWSYPRNNDKVVVDPGPTGPPIQPRVTSPTNGMRQVRFPYQLRVAWDPVARVTQYRVRTNWQYECDTSATECVFSVDRVGDYVVRVSACNNDGCSSEGLVILTLTTQGGVPVLKQGLGAVVPGDESQRDDRAPVDGDTR